MNSEFSQIGVRLPTELRARLEEFSRTANLSLSELMRRAVKMYLDEGVDAWARVEQARQGLEADCGCSASPEVRLYGQWLHSLPDQPRSFLQEMGDYLSQRGDDGELCTLVPDFLSQATAGVFRLDFEEPISIALPVAEQLERGFRTGYVGECNNTAAKLHGYRDAAELIGVPAASALPASDPRNRAVILAFLRNGYRVVGAVVRAAGPDGETFPIHISMFGTVRNHHVINLWGVSHEMSVGSTPIPPASSLQVAPEGTWCLEFVPAISTQLSEREQVRQIFRAGFFGPCSTAFCRLYGIEDPRELDGRALTEFLPESDPQNLESVITFVRAGYRFLGARLHASGENGAVRITHNNLIGHVIGDELVRLWGSQQDITAFLAN